MNSVFDGLGIKCISGGGGLGGGILKNKNIHNYKKCFIHLTKKEIVL